MLRWPSLHRTDQRPRNPFEHRRQGDAVQDPENKVSAGILVRNSAGLQLEYREIDTTLAFPTHANDGIVLDSRAALQSW